MKNPFKTITNWWNKPLLSKRDEKKYELLGAFLGPFVGILIIAPIVALLIIVLK